MSTPGTSPDRTQIDYLDGKRLARALRAGISRLLTDQEHLNKINVYPVPDGDTGTNLALTSHSIAPVISQDVPAHVGQLLILVADAALDGARGNSGAILAQFLQGLADHCAQMPALSAGDLAAGCATGAAYAREAMSEPVEGTILTVLDDFSKTLTAQVNSGVSDLAVAFHAAHSDAHKSLANTPRLLEALRKANVVDAGAAGFVDLLDGIAMLLRDGIEGELIITAPVRAFSDEMTAGTQTDLRYRYCTECMVTNPAINRRKLREDLSSLGNSLVIAGSHAKVRVHIHTNEADKVFSQAARHGAVSGQKADDMQRQQDLTHAAERSIVITTDTAADVPDEQLERLNIYLTPVRLHIGEKSYLDRVTITADQFYEKLRNETAPATTSQPAPGDFRRQFEFLKSHYRDVVSIHVSAQASGTWQAARKAADTVADGNRIHVVDSATASLGQGLLVIDAAQAAQSGMSADQLLQRIDLMKELTQTFCILRDLSYGVRGGRISARVKTIADLLHLTPVLKINKGVIRPASVFFGRHNIIEKFAQYIARQTSSDKTYRLGIGYADCQADGEMLLALLEDKIPNRHQTIFTQIGTALGVHTGPEGLVVGLQEYVPLDSDIAIPADIPD